MPYRLRHIEKAFVRASNSFPILFVTGPRQCGKTTLLRHLASKSRSYVTLDDLNAQTLAHQDPALFLQQFPPPVIIDEIQHAPQLFPAIKQYADESRQPGLFWLTGSQQFQLMKGVTESMAGRVALIQLHGFSEREKNKKTGFTSPFLPNRESLKKNNRATKKTTLHHIYDSIWTGSMPALVTGTIKDRELFYSSYLSTYLQRDVRDLAQVGSLTDFTRFIRACAARTGQLLNLSELARDTGVSVPTAKHWLSILIASLQIQLLEPYHTSVTKRLIKTPKLYFLDTGLCAYLTGWQSAESLQNGAMAGSMLETFIFSEIIKSYWYDLKSPSIYFYRDKDGREIDFILEMDGRLHPIEIKRGSTIKTDWTQSFPALDRLKLPRGEGAVICFVEQMTAITSSISAIPVNWV